MNPEKPATREEIEEINEIMGINEDLNEIIKNQ